MQDVNPQNKFQIIDPVTLQKIGGIRTVPNFPQIQGISATVGGDIFLATNPGIVYHYDSNLNLLKSLTVDFGGSTFHFNPYGLKLYESGKIVMGDRFGRVVMTDSSLNSFTSFTVGSFGTYAALIIPEPSTITLLTIGIFGLLVVRRRR